MDTHYETAIKELESEIERLNSRTDGLRFAIDTLRSHSNSGDAAATPKTQIGVSERKNLFNEVDNSLTPSERVDIVYHSLLNLNRYSKLKSIREESNNRFEPTQIRLALINLHKEGKIDKIQITTSNEDTFYGIPSWKDGNKIKQTHEYDKKELVGRTMR